MVDQYLRWQAKGFAKLIAEAESNSSNAYFLIKFLVQSEVEVNQGYCSKQTSS